MTEARVTIPDNVREAAELLHKHVCDHKNKGKPNHQCQGALIVMKGRIEAECGLCGHCVWDEKGSWGRVGGERDNH